MRRSGPASRLAQLIQTGLPKTPTTSCTTIYLAGLESDGNQTEPENDGHDDCSTSGDGVAEGGDEPEVEGEGYEGGDADAVFILGNGATLKNAIIGKDRNDGVHCKGSCTIES